MQNIAPHTENIKQSNKFTIAQFRAQFPTEDSCLDYLCKQKYGGSGCSSCGIDKKLQRVNNRRSYQCPTCTAQFYPTVGTIFEKSTTPLTYWFYAIYLYTATRNGVAAKELERQLGVTYKTALRMAHNIRTLMLDNSNSKLFGFVCADETYLGMLGKNMHQDKKPKEGLTRGKSNKIGVMGMMDKEGNMITKVLKEETGDMSFIEILKDNIHQDSVVITDSAYAYKNTEKHFKEHISVDHTKNEFSKDGFSTNAIENYWSNLKRMIKGTHIHVSKKHLPKYVAENTFRYVNRKQGGQMFSILIDRIVVKGGKND